MSLSICSLDLNMVLESDFVDQRRRIPTRHQTKVICRVISGTAEEDIEFQNNL